MHALLTVKDDNFWEGLTPVEFGDLPALQDVVTIVGFPAVAGTVSIIGAVVSQIDIVPYVYGACEFLGLQINKTVVIGISGAPAFSDKGTCVGIAFQGVDIEDNEREAIGFVIPTPIIMHFIQDYEKNGRYTGFPALGVEWQKMENKHLRSFFGMEPMQTGVRVKRIDPTSSMSNVLKPSDIILRFDGVNIANDGTIPFWPGERIRFNILASLKYTGEIAEIDVLRNSEILKFNVELGSQRRLIPTHSDGRPPSYYIIGGFVFVTVSLPYLQAEGHCLWTCSLA